MTSPQRNLLTASDDERRPLLHTLEHVARSRLQLDELVRAEIGHGMTFGQPW